jgi:plastin-1
LLGSLTEKDLIAWVNETCPDSPIKNFKDAALGDGQILIKMCADIEPRVVNWDLVTKGETDEEKEMNAKYAISIARKLGAVIFLVWEDIPQLNPKMILVFVCALWDLKQLAKQ